jgi:hypothetical protein
MHACIGTADSAGTLTLTIPGHSACDFHFCPFLAVAARCWLGLAVAGCCRPVQTPTEGAGNSHMSGRAESQRVRERAPGHGDHIVRVHARSVAKCGQACPSLGAVLGPSPRENRPEAFPQKVANGRAPDEFQNLWPREGPPIPDQRPTIRPLPPPPIIAHPSARLSTSTSTSTFTNSTVGSQV